MQTLLIILFLAMIIVGCLSAGEDVSHVYDAKPKPDGPADESISGPSL